MTAMNTLHHEALEMPRFANGMLDLRELGRTLIEALVNKVMSAVRGKVFLP